MSPCAEKVGVEIKLPEVPCKLSMVMCDLFWEHRFVMLSVTVAMSCRAYNDKKKVVRVVIFSPAA